MSDSFQKDKKLNGRLEVMPGTGQRLEGMRSLKNNPEAWRQFTTLFENRDRLYPFLVVEDEAIIVCDSIAKVLQHNDNSLLLKQWPGQYRSDWFYTTIGEFKAKLDEKKNERTSLY